MANKVRYPHFSGFKIKKSNKIDVVKVAHNPRTEGDLVFHERDIKPLHNNYTRYYLSNRLYFVFVGGKKVFIIKGEISQPEPPKKTKPKLTRKQWIQALDEYFHNKGS